MPAEALRAEVDAYVAAFAKERDENGRRLVVRNGYHQARVVATSAGAVRVTVPRVNDKRTDPGTGEWVRFSSAILPPWCRKIPKINEVLALRQPMYWRRRRNQRTRARRRPSRRSGTPKTRTTRWPRPPPSAPCTGRSSPRRLRRSPTTSRSCSRSMTIGPSTGFTCARPTPLSRPSPRSGTARRSPRAPVQRPPAWRWHSNSSRPPRLAGVPSSTPRRACLGAGSRRRAGAPA